MSDTFGVELLVSFGAIFSFHSIAKTLYLKVKSLPF